MYELHVPPEERYNGWASDATMDKIQETVLDWKDKHTHTGWEHFLGKQTVPDKVVADSVEAIIGAYLWVSKFVLFVTHSQKFQEFSLWFLREYYSTFLVGKMMIFQNILGNSPKI